MKRRKPKGARKETSVRFRLTDEERAKIDGAAVKAHLDLSAWIRTTLLREAEKD